MRLFKAFIIFRGLGITVLIVINRLGVFSVPAGHNTPVPKIVLSVVAKEKAFSGRVRSSCVQGFMFYTIATKAMCCERENVHANSQENV